MRYIDIIRGNIDNHRARRGMTQQDLGAAVGISRAAFSSKLHGHSSFDIGLLVRVAVALGVDFHELIEDIEQSDELDEAQRKEVAAA